MDLTEYYSWDFEENKLPMHTAPYFEEPHNYVFSELLREAITIILN